jgi:hypothetical protein
MKDNTMKTIEYQISQYLDGEISGKKAEKLFQQLASDPQAARLFQQHLQLKNRIKSYYETLPVPSFQKYEPAKNTRPLYWWAAIASAAAVLLLVLLLFNYDRINRVQEEYLQITMTLTELKELVQMLNAANASLSDQNKALIKPVLKPSTGRLPKEKKEAIKSIPAEKRERPEQKHYLAKRRELEMMQIIQAEYIHKPMIGN